MASPIKPYRKLTKTGNGSYYVTIPGGVIQDLGWKAKQRLVVTKTDEGILIRDYEE